MLTDREIGQAASQLQDFRKEAEQYHKTQDEVLEKYSQLMEDYKRLKSDYEEERDSRERYKQLAKGQERNPFVLVLIDGDGCLFQDNLFSQGADGGIMAAQLLNDSIKRSLSLNGLDNCRVMVRIYANLAGLSKALSKTKVCGPEKRSLSPFVANFNRSNDLFDFVDAGELKENADFKIRAMFRQFVDNAQCKHIYFAACHDVGYVSELQPHISSSQSRITLVRAGSGINPEFAKLGLPVEDFPAVFRRTPLHTDMTFYAKSDAPVKSPQPQQQPAVIPSEPTSNVCRFFLRGNCTFGKACKNLHVRAGTNVNNNSGLSDISDLKVEPANHGTAGPFNMPPLAKSDNDFMNGSTNGVSDPTQRQIDLVTLLPREYDIPAGTIAVNRAQQRLDPYLAPPGVEAKSEFYSRTARQKLCNAYHLTGICPNNDCQYDHSTISVGVHQCLVEVAHQMPCPRRGACRSLKCTQGHVCQRSDCKYRGGKAYCKLPVAVHAIDLKVANFVPGTTPSASEGLADESRMQSPGIESDLESSNGQSGALIGGKYIETGTSVD